MKVDRKKLDLILARKCMSVSALRNQGITSNTIVRIRRGENVTTATFGKLAKALGVDPVDIMVEE